MIGLEGCLERADSDEPDAHYTIKIWGRRRAELSRDTKLLAVVVVLDIWRVVVELAKRRELGLMGRGSGVGVG